MASIWGISLLTGPIVQGVTQGLATVISDWIVIQQITNEPPPLSSDPCNEDEKQVVPKTRRTSLWTDMIKFLIIAIITFVIALLIRIVERWILKHKNTHDYHDRSVLFHVCVHARYIIRGDTCCERPCMRMIVSINHLLQSLTMFMRSVL